MNHSILHIEDSEVDHELFKRAVKDIPLQWFHTTAEGYHYLLGLKESEYPSLIVIDLNLPAENGIKLISRIKQNSALKRIPIIVLSSITEMREIDECYSVGANAFLQKTLQPHELMSKVEALINFWLVSVTLPYQENRR